MSRFNDISRFNDGNAAYRKSQNIDFGTKMAKYLKKYFYIFKNISDGPTSRLSTCSTVSVTNKVQSTTHDGQKQSCLPMKYSQLRKRMGRNSLGLMK